MDIPFVSENFQRSYRNRFPSQVSTGRDLHVSDVIIPIVDFTPTASGTSLDLNLRRSRSTNTSRYLQTSSSGSFSDITSNSGFFLVSVSVNVSGSSSGLAEYIIALEDSGGTQTVVSGNYLNYENQMYFNDEFYVFNPSTYKLVAYFNFPDDGDMSILYTQVADVNGNEQLPPLYSPQ